MFSSGVLSSKTLVSIYSNIKKKKFYIRILSIHFYFKLPTARSNQTNEFIEVCVNNEDESNPDKCLTLYAY